MDNRDEEVDEASMEMSFVEEDSAQSRSAASENNDLQPMVFTVPLVRPPKPPSDTWLALRAATHLGDTPSDDEEERGVRDIELTDAVTRLEAARASFALGNSDGEDAQPDGFNSTEDSFAEENSVVSDDGNQTVNVTQLMRRVSLALSTGDSTIEATDVCSAQDPSASVTSAGPSEVLPSLPVAGPSLVPPEPCAEPVSSLIHGLPQVAYSMKPPSAKPSSAAAEKPFSFIPRSRTHSFPRPPSLFPFTFQGKRNDAFP